MGTHVLVPSPNPAPNKYPLIPHPYANPSFVYAYWKEVPHSHPYDLCEKSIKKRKKERKSKRERKISLVGSRTIAGFQGLTSFDPIPTKKKKKQTNK